MNRSFIVAVLTVTMIVMMSTASYAVVAPHGFACDNCHAKHLGTTAPQISNGCITCHNTAGEASTKPMNAGDMSNYFGSSSNQPLKGSKSSHNWLAASPNSRAAADEPTINSELNYPTTGYVSDLTGSVSCVRCHYIKDNTNYPLLRISNANDALCLDCHKKRNTTLQTAGTHPVLYRSYSAAYKSNTSAFRKVPKNANPYNRTSDLSNYFTAGQKITCTTCHATHFADSNSSTFDNRSTAKGSGVDDPAKGLKATFQDSNGELLRTDRYGVTANSVNICSSCHKETKNLNHNGKGQNIQCDHCHGAHVDYTGDGSAPNYYLVRRDFSNMSIATRKLATGTKVIYNGATSLKFVRGDSKGICQVCHAVPHPVVDARKEDCVSCHKHTTGFTATNCNSCHGYPPTASSVGGTDGKASKSYSLDESFTPHATHADKSFYNYACKNCHYDGVRADSHNNGTFQSVFVDTAGSVGAGAGFPNNPSHYNATDRTCSNVYCHSNGNPRNGTIAFKTTLGWELGKNKIVGKNYECTSCHEYGNTLVTNSHAAHVTSVGLKCYVCHNATVNMAGGISDRTKHANGVKDISFVARPDNFNGLFNATYSIVPSTPTDKFTCTNTCHGTSTPVWGDATTAQCGSCHAVPATTGAHTFHFSGTTGPKLGTSQTVCANCHDFVAGNGKHANGKIDVKLTIDQKTDCTPCHPGTAPVWTNAATVTCESCHTGTASVVGSYTAPLKALGAGHSKYSSAALAKVRCTTCHDATANHIGAGPTEKRLKIAGNGLCDSCHTTAANKGLPVTRIDLPAHGGSTNLFTHYTSAASLGLIQNVRSDACAGCHDTHGTTNNYNVRTIINGQAVVYKNVSGLMVTAKNINNIYNGLCQVCHTKTKYYRNYTSPKAHYTGNCLSCHVHKTGTFAFAPVGGGCAGCHGYPPVKDMTGLGVMNNYTNAKIEDYAGGGGAHTVAGHIPKTVTQDGGSANCTNCHFDFNNSHNNGGGSVNQNFVNVVVDPKYKFNNASTIVYKANSCSNVSCHFRPSPNWVTGN